MNLDRMLAQCSKGQWRIADLDWSVRPRPMRQDEEIAIVQYFINMSGIERLAGALFAEQRRRESDPALRQIFTSFIGDEERHAQAAERLAAHYDVHRYRDYRLSPELCRFRPHFLDAVRYMSPEIANTYITGGELLLDVALLRSLNDYVADGMSAQVMELINRDESRHIAIDYYMMERYASDEYQRSYRPEARSPAQWLRVAWSFSHMIYWGQPFLAAVFLQPMKLTDPHSRRLREAFKRMQLLGCRPDLVRRPFSRFLYLMRKAHNHKLLGPVLGPLFARLGNAPGEFMPDMYTQEEERRAAAMTMDEMAQEALQAKYKA